VRFWYEQTKIAGLNQWQKEWELCFNNNSEPYTQDHIVDFTYNGWDRWYHPLQGSGAILSRKGERADHHHAVRDEGGTHQTNQ
jgi:hypothetical protein